LDDDSRVSSSYGLGVKFKRWTPWPRPEFTLLNYSDSYLRTWHGP
jgi:hypothetical protein